MDEEKARKKEAKRTLNRIKSTLSKLEDGSGFASKNALEKSEEYQRMKELLEHGYAHNKPGPIKQILILIRHPVFVVFLIIVFLMIVVK
jgi:hypothetical protein